MTSRSGGRGRVVGIEILGDPGDPTGLEVLTIKDRAIGRVAGPSLRTLCQRDDCLCATSLLGGIFSRASRVRLESWLGFISAITSLGLPICDSSTRPGR